ncbi:MAG: L-histidine N(alpha)-methyltransferase [Bacteroidia bacterium]
MQSKFSEAVVHGLSSNPKRLPSDYLFDETGIRLLDEIRHMPEFYAAPCELGIFKTHATEMAELLYKPGLRIIEKGAGDTAAIYYLLKALLERDKNIRYSPVDNSVELLNLSQEALHKRLPELKVEPGHGDFFTLLESREDSGTNPKLIVIPASRIGNLSYQDALSVLKQVHRVLHTGDNLLLGIDLKKAPSLILPAHADPTGINARYNLNLLERINRDLGGHFNTKYFKHYASYEPETGELRNYLIAQKEQEVLIEKLNRSFHFDAWENVQTEIAKKYSPEEFRQLSSEAGFTWVEAYYDPELFFMDVVLSKGL